MSNLIETARRGGPLAATILEQFATTILLEDAFQNACKTSSSVILQQFATTILLEDAYQQDAFQNACKTSSNVIPIYPACDINKARGRVRSFRSGLPARRCLFCPLSMDNGHPKIPEQTANAEPDLTKAQQTICDFDASSTVLDSSSALLSPGQCTSPDVYENINIPQRSALSIAQCASFDELMQIYGAKLLPDESQDAYVLRITNNLFMYSQ